MSACLAKPNKYLRYDDKHFEGYWMQLLTLIHHNDSADQILDGILEHPLRQLSELDPDDGTE